jgi:hypothetical protein
MSDTPIKLRYPSCLVFFLIYSCPNWYIHISVVGLIIRPGAALSRKTRRAVETMFSNALHFSVKFFSPYIIL